MKNRYLTSESSNSELTINRNWIALMKMKTMAQSLQYSTMSFSNFSFRFLSFPCWTSAAPTWLPCPSSVSSKSVLGLKWSIAVNPSYLKFCSSLPLHNIILFINSNLQEFRRLPAGSDLSPFVVHVIVSCVPDNYLQSWAWMVLGQVDTLQFRKGNIVLCLHYDCQSICGIGGVSVVDGGADCMMYIS